MKNSVAKAINVFGILMYVFGFLGAIGYYLSLPAIGPKPDGTFFIMLIYIVSGVFFGVLLQGFSRVVEYLYDIRNHLIGNTVTKNEEEEEEDPPKYKPLWDLRKD